MEVGMNIPFDYFMDVFRIHLIAICHLSFTAIKFHNEDRSLPCKMVCQSEHPTNTVIEICMAMSTGSIENESASAIKAI